MTSHESLLDRSFSSQRINALAMSLFGSFAILLAPVLTGLRASSWYTAGMAEGSSPLAAWSPAQLAQGRLWVSTWERAGRALEAVRRDELRNLDAYAAIAMLCGPADYHVAPRAPKPTSGLIEQQRLFRRAQPR